MSRDDKQITANELRVLLECHDELETLKKCVSKIYYSRDEIINACNSEISDDIIDGISPHIPVFLQITEMKESLLKLQEKIKMSYATDPDPSLVVTVNVIDSLRNFIKLWKYQDDFIECIDAEDINTVRDFLQGDLLFSVENVAIDSTNFMEVFKILKDLKYLYTLGIIKF